jgi:hypothetical protein
LHHWLPHFNQVEPKPVLVRITRSTDSLIASFRRRQSPGDVAMRVEQLMTMCRQQYQAWPWMRLTIDYELRTFGAECDDVRCRSLSECHAARPTAAGQRAVATAVFISGFGDFRQPRPASG